MQRFAPNDSGAYLMLVLKEKMTGVHSLEKWQHLGLTTSEAEGLCRTAHGKNNQAVAIILNKAFHTIKKHVAYLIQKLEV